MDLPRCVAVRATGESLTYVTRKAAPAAHLRRHIQRVAAAPIPNGLFIFDVIAKSDQAPMNYRTWRATCDGAVLAKVADHRDAPYPGP